MKIPKTVTLKTLVAAILATLLACGFIFYVLAPTPSSTFWISPGVYPGASAYTIFVESGNYFAKSPFGELEHTGTNLSEICNNIVSGGDSLYFSSGSYTLTHSVIITTSGLSITGESNLTQISYTGSDSSAAFIVGDDSSDIRDVILRDFRLTMTTNATGILFYGRTYYCTIDKVKIELPTSGTRTNIGIDFNATSNWLGYHNLWGVDVVECLTAIRFSGIQDHTGVQIHSGFFKGRDQTLGYLFDLNDTNTLQIYGASLSNAETAIYIDNAYANFFYGLRFETVNVSIRATNTANYNRFIGCSLANYNTWTENDGVHNRFKQWYGDCYTEYNVTRSITGSVSSFTYAHLLFAQPDIVAITAQQGGQGDFWLIDKNVTHVELGFENQPGASTWYFDLYLAISA